MPRRTALVLALLLVATPAVYGSSTPSATAPRPAVYAVVDGEHQAVWTTATDQMLEIAGFRGFEVFLVFTSEPFESPADAWNRDHCYLGLDLQAPGVGVYPTHIDTETIAAIRGTIPPE